MKIEDSNYVYYGKQNILTKLRSLIALRARKRLYFHFLKCCQPTAADLIIDIGVTPDINFPESNLFEKNYPFADRITATSIEDVSELEKMFPDIKFMQTMPYSLPFADQHFDCLFCNAVVEHTGAYEQQLAFIQECTRISRKFFFTTPNRWFPIEMHSILPFVHWLPQKKFRKILCLLGKSDLACEENLNLLTIKQFKALFPPEVKIQVTKIYTFGWISNLIVSGEWVN